MSRIVSSLVWSALALSSVPACGLLEAATSDRPSSRQLDALGDAFTAAAAFGALVADPAAASEADLADLHQTEPYQVLLDPDAGAARRLRAGDRRLDACASKTGDMATWACPVTVGGVTCTATGEGARSADGTYTGRSTQACPGGLTVEVSATGVLFDEVAGRGEGTLAVRVALPGLELRDWARMTLTGLGFCLDESPPKPNAGRVDVDGLGSLDGLPFDPIGIRFSGDPVCGTALLD